MTIERLTQEEIGENITRVVSLLAELERPGIATVVDDMVARNYFRAPASTRYHGAFEGGLTAHSLAIYDCFKQRVEDYGLDVPEESIRISALLHDYCKIDIYEPHKLADGSVSEKKPWVVKDDLPLGHGEKSVMQLLRLGLEMTDQEMMLIRWHMGSYEGEPWKANVNKIREQYPEVLVFHHVDNEVSTVLGL